MTGTTSATSSTSNGPRRHHYVPRCWLAGFTDTGEQDGGLFVTDFTRRKQWAGVPGSVGFIRDFYRLEDEQIDDPVRVEKALSQIEGEVAPILRAIDRERRSPKPEEIDPLLYFMAIQWSRVPAFRPLVLSVAKRISDERITEILQSPDSWKAALERAGISPDTPGAEYEEMKAAFEADAFNLSAPTDWYVQRAFRAVDAILPGLHKRYWTTLVSPSGSFIGSDNPVALDGEKGKLIGFENAEMVSYTVSRHVTVWGTLEPMKYPRVNRKFIAHANTLSLLHTDGQVFSREPDFCWLDENQKYQTAWASFSKDKY
jgi:hypothetical protein